MEPVARLRDGTEVAAWLFKANPVVWDVVGAIRAGEPIDAWPMVDNYRVDLVHPGHPCVLWVTGGRNAPTTGVWGIGEVSSEPYVQPSSRNESEQPWVGLDLDLLDAPVRLRELVADERFGRCEIVRAPRVSSPVALTADEFTAILDAWPE
ncbi:MAG: EVE domain-containing protein [Acidimicrobiales bacterium]